MGELSKLPNIGKVLEKQLNEVGINTADELIDIGSKEAWLKKLRLRHSKVSRMFSFGMSAGRTMLSLRATHQQVQRTLLQKKDSRL